MSLVASFVAVEELDLKALCILLTRDLTVFKSDFLDDFEVLFADVTTSSVDVVGRGDVGCALEVDWSSDELADGSVDITSSLSLPPRRGVSSAVLSCSWDPLMITVYSFVAAITLISGDPKTCSISDQEFGMSCYEPPYIQRNLDRITEVIFKFSYP
jgi:hypothetical protein